MFTLVGGRVFFYQCVNMAWKAKSIESLPLSILLAYYKQTMSMTLQRAQASDLYFEKYYCNR
jgi:hypothetical protein